MAPAEDEKDLRALVKELHQKVDELLEDSRRARPLLDRYISMQGRLPWMKQPKARA